MGLFLYSSLPHLSVGLMYGGGGGGVVVFAVLVVRKMVGQIV